MPDLPRFTPAGAGTTPLTRSRRSVAPVHPRRRGDNAPLPGGSRGGPVHPRRRGDNVVVVARHHDEERFTPAGAGTTEQRSASSAQAPVHPRRRGDNVSQSCGSRDSLGSPPQARGQRELVVWESRLTRFTPAGAGTTSSHSSPRHLLTVHPRRRGDNNAQGVQACAFDGSPPQARGQRRYRCWRCSAPPVHPRRRGDNEEGLLGRFNTAGSPPQARGQRGMRCSGSTSSTVHPRRRGDNPPPSRVRRSTCGSPPQARGQRSPRVRA